MQLISDSLMEGEDDTRLAKYQIESNIRELETSLVSMFEKRLGGKRIRNPMEGSFSPSSGGDVPGFKSDYFG